MEAIGGLVLPLIAAGAVISLYAILRLVFRTDRIASDIPAYAAAVLLTFAVAASLFYLGVGLAGVVPDLVAFFGTFAIHGALVWFFQSMLPVESTAGGRAQMTAQRAAA